MIKMNVLKTENTHSAPKRERSPASVSPKNTFVQTKLSIAQPNDKYEQEADRIADHVVHSDTTSSRLLREKPQNVDRQSGKLHKKPLRSGNQELAPQPYFMKQNRTILSQPPAHTTQPRQISTNASPSIQRFALVGGTLQDENDPNLNNNMRSYATDKSFRNYHDIEEFKEHAAGQTDYIGNVFSGPYTGFWVRFPQQGLNILGESHQELTLKDLMPAVNSTNFIGERFASEDMHMFESPEFQSTYLDLTQEEFEHMGIDQDPDKQQYGGESLLMKTGFVLHHALQFLQPDGMDILRLEGYFGKPLQRYLLIAWAWSKDNLDRVIQMQSLGQEVMLEKEVLAEIHRLIAPQIEPFLNSLSPDDYLENSLGLPYNRQIIPLLREFAGAFSQITLRMMIEDTDSGLTNQQRDELDFNRATPRETSQAYQDVRNHSMYKLVTHAAANGVRYAGYGSNHLTYITNRGLPANSQGILINGEGLQRIINLNHMIRTRINQQLEERSTP